MNRKAIDGKTVILLTVILTISTVTLTIPPTATAPYPSLGVTQYSWPMFQHDLNNTGYTDSPAPKTRKLLWNTTVGSVAAGGATVADGIVYVAGLLEYPERNLVYALNMSTGEKLWNFTAGYIVRCAPAVADGIVYVGSEDGKLYALDAATGEEEWTYQTMAQITRSHPTVVDGIVYIGSYDGNVYALNATTGAFVWRYDTGDKVRGSPAVVDGTLYIGSASNKMYALDAATGDLEWSYTTRGDVRGSPAVVDGKVFFGQYDGGRNDGVVFCLDATTGDKIWNYTTLGTIYSSPAVAYGLVFIGSNDWNVYALNMTTGETVWSYTLDGPIYYASPTVADGLVFIGSYVGTLYCLNATAEALTAEDRLVWSCEMGGSIRGPCAIAYGLVFAGSFKFVEDTGELCAFGALTQVGPEASFTYSPTIPMEDEVVNFDASASSPGWNGMTYVPIANYTWDFGDGNVTIVDAPTATVTHVYNSTGTFTVNLTVTCEDDYTLIAEGLTADSTWQDVNVIVPPPPSPPVASFTVSPGPYYVNEITSFDAGSSQPGWNGTHNIPIANYTWDFGDGDTATVTNPLIYHTYTLEGEYTVNLTVTCVDEPILIAGGLTSDSTWHNITVILFSPEPHNGVTEYPWPMGGHDLKRTGYTDAPAPQTNKTYWTYATGNKIRSGPAVVDGIVYIGSDDNELHAIEMDTGVPYWSYTTGDDVRSVPAVYDDKVYFGSDDGNVYCLTAGWTGGSLVWSWPSLVMPPTGNREVRSSPAVADGKVVIGSRDANVYCLNADTGASIWNYTTGDDVRSGPAIADGLVYIGSDDNTLYCLNLTTGEKLWEYDTGSDVYRTPAISDGLVFAASNSKKTVYALNLTTGVSVRNYTVTGDIRGSIAVAEGKLYVAGTSDGRVWAFDISTGATLWTHSTTAGSWWGIPVVADGLVFIIAMDGYIYALDMDTGAVVWKYLTGSTSGNDWAVGAVADGFLFIGSGDYNVYAFGVPPLRPLLFMGPASIIDEYSINESFTVSVKIQNVTGLYSWYIGLQWNPDILECTAADYVDTFLPGQAEYPNNYLEIAGMINNTAGQIYPPYARTLTGFGNAGGVNGSGTLMTATFRVKDYGETWINLTDAELFNSTPNLITVNLQNCWFKLSLPPPKAPVAYFTETPPPYYVNETVIFFDASGSTPGWNGTHFIPIANYTWDFGDGNVTTVTVPTITHIYASEGEFDVYLTVMCEDDPILIAAALTSDTSDPETKIVFPVYEPTGLDLYTETERFQEPPTEWIGEGPYMPADAYRPDENVTLYVNLAYNGDAVQSRLISFEVRDPHNDIVLVRTAMTNSTGTATISFRIETVCGNPEYAFGKWSVIAKSTICDVPINDTLQFDVGWIIELTEVVPLTGTFKKGEHITFTVYGENMALHAKNFTLTLVIYDNDGVPIANTVIDTQVPAGEPCLPNPFEIEVTCLEIPKWAYVGPATVYANAFYSLPSDCGVSMCPEISAPFIIEAAP